LFDSKFDSKSNRGQGQSEGHNQSQDHNRSQSGKCPATTNTAGDAGKALQPNEVDAGTNGSRVGRKRSHVGDTDNGLLVDCEIKRTKLQLEGDLTDDSKGVLIGLHLWSSECVNELEDSDHFDSSGEGKTFTTRLHPEQRKENDEILSVLRLHCAWVEEAGYVVRDGQIMHASEELRHCKDDCLSPMSADASTAPGRASVAATAYDGQRSAGSEWQEDIRSKPKGPSMGSAGVEDNDAAMTSQRDQYDDTSLQSLLKDCKAFRAQLVRTIKLQATGDASVSAAKHSASGLGRKPGLVGRTGAFGRAGGASGTWKAKIAACESVHAMSMPAPTLQKLSCALQQLLMRVGEAVSSYMEVRDRRGVAGSAKVAARLLLALGSCILPDDLLCSAVEGSMRHEGVQTTCAVVLLAGTLESSLHRT
jgi:hypothetical protein